MKQIRYLNLFSGCGGFEIGAHAALGERLKTVALAEVDKHASAVLAHNFPGITNLGDVTKVDWSKLGKVDLLTASPPCQAWSVAGKRGGFTDARGTLFSDCAKAVEALRPRWFILENVKGLLSHDGGRSLEQILALFPTGYTIRYQVLNALDYGVPQRRERVFIIGFRERADAEAFVWPAGTPRIQSIADILEDDVDQKYYVRPETARKLLSKVDPAKLIASLEGKDSGELHTLTKAGTSDALRVYGAKGVNPTLKALGGGLGAKTGIVMVARNQRGEVRTMRASGALPASQSAKQMQAVVVQRERGKFAGGATE